MSGSKRLVEIDRLRGFAIFCVVLGHAIIVFPVNLHEIVWCRFLYSFIYSFHMPLFFAISGYCYSMKIEYHSYLKKKVMRLLLPYFSFSLISMVMPLILPDLVNHKETVWASIVSILFNGGEYWFLYTLFIISVVFPFIEKFLRYPRERWYVVVLIIALSMLGGILPNIFCLTSISYYVVFFTLGYLFKQCNVFQLKDVIKPMSVLLKVVFLFLFTTFLLLSGYMHERFNVRWLNMVEGMVGIFYFFIVSITIPSLLKHFEKFSRYSLALYLLNGYWLVISRTLVTKVLGIQNPIIIIIANVLLDFYLSYFVILLLSKIAVFRKVMGIQLK